VGANSAEIQVLVDAAQEGIRRDVTFQTEPVELALLFTR
jgi:hypothetical protein